MHRKANNKNIFSALLMSTKF